MIHQVFESADADSEWRDVRVVEGTGLENRRCESIRGFESHSLRQIFLRIEFNTLTEPRLEKYSSGRRGAPAKGVGRVTVARVQIPQSPPKIRYL